MNLKNYFFVAVLIFFIGLFGLYTGINRSSADKPPVIHQDQWHSMKPNNSEQ